MEHGSNNWHMQASVPAPHPTRCSPHSRVASQAAASAVASAMYLGSGSVVSPMPREVIWRVGVGLRERLL